jgi:hypothetical protein
MIQIKISKVGHPYYPEELLVHCTGLNQYALFALPAKPETPLSVTSVHCARFNVLKYRVKLVCSKSPNKVNPTLLT